MTEEEKALKYMEMVDKATQFSEAEIELWTRIKKSMHYIREDLIKDPKNGCDTVDHPIEFCGEKFVISVNHQKTKSNLILVP